MTSPPYRLAETVAAAVRESGQRIVITGAGGWIGLATLEMLVGVLGPQFAGRVSCFGSAARELRLRDGTRVQQQPLQRITELTRAPTLVLHTAFLTKDKVAGMNEADYVATNRQIAGTVLSALDAIGATGVFVASSGAARHAEDPEAAYDLALYGQLKRDDEDRFAAWATDRGLAAAIARIFSVTGPYINKPETYALASFLLQARSGGPIEVRATSRVLRSYAAIRDLMSLTFSILLRQPPTVVRFDTGGEPMEMAEIAQAAAVAAGGGRVHRAALNSGSDNIYTGADEPWRALLAAAGLRPASFAEQVRETAAYLLED